MKKIPKLILEQQAEQQRKKKQQRQSKAVQKFSKGRFMQQTRPIEKIQEIDTNLQNLQNQMKRNLKIDLIDTLLSMNVDLDHEEKAISWLNLSFYDYKNEDRSILAEGETLSARCLLKINSKHDYVRGDITKYCPQKNKYKFIYQNQDQVTKAVLVPRIYLCIDYQNPIRYCQRVSKAYFARIYADNLIKFRYYIDAMPTESLKGVPTHQRNQIYRLVQSLHEYNGMDDLMNQVEIDYYRTINSLILKKQLQQNRQQMIPTSLIVSFAKPKKIIPQYGLISINRQSQIVIQNGIRSNQNNKSFIQNFELFCEQTILSEKNVIHSLKQIKQQCDKIAKIELLKFNTTQKQPMKLQQYQSEQNSHLQRTINRLRNGWINTIKEIIQRNFKNGEVSWYQTNMDTKAYNVSKMKKYFKIVKYIMEDTLKEMAINSFNKMYHFITSFIPIQVKIKSIGQVNNIFINSGEKQLHTSSSALFETDIIRAAEDKNFCYATLCSHFVQSIMSNFTKMIYEINKISEVQQKIMIQIFKKQKHEKYLTAPNRQDALQGSYDLNIWLKQLHTNLKIKLQQSMEPINKYLEQVNKLTPVLQMKPDEIIKQIDIEDEQNPKDILTLKEEVQNYYQKQQQLLNNVPQNIQVSFLKIKLKDIIQYLAQKYHQTAKGLELIIAKKAKKATKMILDKLDQIKATIRVKPMEIEKLVEIRDFMAYLPLQLQKIRKDIDEANTIYDVLDEFKFTFTPQNIKKRYLAMITSRAILDEAEKKKKQIELKKGDFHEQLINQQDQFKNNIENLSRLISQFHTYNKKQQHQEIAQKAKIINQALNNSNVQAKKFNSREILFDKDITDYSKIQEISKEFLPYSNLWLITNNWTKNIDLWLHGKWNQVDADLCEKFVQDSLKSLNQAIRHFKDKEIVHILKITQSTKAQIEEFKPKVPLLSALRKVGLRKRHWQQISQKVGFKLEPDANFTFSKALEMKLMKHIDVCIEIGDQSMKQFTIEKNLNEMLLLWQTINFQFTQYKNSYIIKSFDDVANIVDQHIANTQSILFSPFKKPFEYEIIEWFGNLKKISDIIEEWIKLQMNWMYLQPIFDSPDIAKQLHKESKNFKIADTFCKSIINKSKEINNVDKICKIQDLLEKLKENNQSLDIIQKSLNNYLQSKRAKFARFYFLSNNQLLEILSQAKQPLAVQPHLKKVFQNISQVEFNNQRNQNTILSMLSAEKQKINFDKSIDPKGKNVQDWMTELEQQMKSSIRSVLMNSIQDYKQIQRHNWVLKHPGQCVLNGSQVEWTHQVQENIINKSIKKYFETLTNQLKHSVQLVRRKLSKNQSVTLNALIVIDVHARDVVQNLLKNTVEDINAFQWISQLRYYWENDNCKVKCVQTIFPYGYEYLGNTLRLVITPLTDKCYMTLMGALKLNLGGAPAGPAGTGKTQTTKDLAKALAKQCVVFNCSDSMDFIMVGKFFKGLAAAGAWACFDQFNRINIQVLSVIAQQLLVLFTEKAKGSETLQFQGSQIHLQSTFSVFITMNPGYAGRTQLPDNLKALFRPVAMMVPDYAMIGEIMLYSFGFSMGRALAKKMVATFRLASEQLSSQDHYDYGMRAVRSVINAAGILKQRDPDMDEDILLLRALRDVNVPKFLKNDLPLFENIIQDLFPGIQRPMIDYGELSDAITQVCKMSNFNLQPVQAFMSKIIQLYDTIQVRHGLMLVGPTGGGKTCTYQVLKTALTNLHSKGYYKVSTHVINPKSINMGQLYGQFNETSRQWIDGVLAYTVRKCCSDRTNQRHWVMFDGPVDALWIENMNTVLDDNKKLCLNSGQILTLTPYMTMMFEVQDLQVASPATVSRCGMVYMQPAALGISPLTYQWFKIIPPKIFASKKCKEMLTKFIETIVYDSIDYVRKNCRQMIKSMDQNLLQSFFKLLNCFFINYLDNELIKVSNQQIIKLENNLSNLLIFCLYWSIGATCDYQGRNQFNQKARQMLAQQGYPLKHNYYDYYYCQSTQEFQLWTTRFANYQVNSQRYHEIIVPTTNSQRYTFITKMLLSCNYHVMVPGSTGTGKSVNCLSLISTGMGEQYQYIPITFSAQTSANQTQDSIDLKLQKIKRGVYGAPVGKKYIIFIDDLNMPKKQQYGAQPPIELLRQFLDHHGWYNRKDQQFMKIENIILLSALGPPGGGRTFITSRMVRHFNLLAYTELTNSTIGDIFNCIVGYFLRKFPEEVKSMSEALVSSVINIYESVRMNLLPTPKKSHYTFNLRDISKVFQGICSASIKYNNSKISMVKLWFHEIFRVFGDRLINIEDRTYLEDHLLNNLNIFGVDKEELFSDNKQPIIFCDFWQGRELQPRHYQQITNCAKFIDKIYEFQEEYNMDVRFSGARGKNALNLVLFQDACEHISRVVRIIRQPNGNALLLGVGGSGRQSLAKIAIFIANHQLRYIELIKNYSIKSWREDLKKILMQTGIDNKQTSFLFVDTQIIQEQMVEDLNSVLNSGDITGIYQEKDLEEIMNACKADCLRKGLQPNKMNIFAQYLGRVRQNIHIVMAMSPLSSSFSTRLRMFPSLVNCCTLDWFNQWPEQALLAVGKGQIHDFMEENGLVQQEDKIIELFTTIHKSVQTQSKSYLNELRRYNYITPMSYLELLKIFKLVQKQKQQELKMNINRLKTGLDKLIAANTEVAEMQIQLKDLQPQLQKSAIETQELIKQIQIQKADAQKTQKIVSKEQAQAKFQTQQALQIAKEVDVKVQDAKVKLAESLKAVDKLKTDHLVQIKSHKSPPKVAVVVLGGCVILFEDMIKSKGHEIIMKKIEGSIKKQQDWFNTARLQLLENPKNFLQQLKNYDKQHINQGSIGKFNQKILKDPDYNYEKAKAVGGPIQALYLWEMAMYSFNKIYLDTQPLREKQASVKQLVAQKTAMLNEKKKILNGVIEKINELEKGYEQCINKKEELTKKIQQCEIKLERAKKLTSGLSDEKQRWTEEVERLCSLIQYIPGNSILSTSMISYGGVFTSEYRLILHEQWLQNMRHVGVLYEDDTNLMNFLGKPVLIQQWMMSGLPKDLNSIENGLIIQKTRRWPLMIDPQGQANKFIKSMGRQCHLQGIDVVKQKQDAKLMKTLQLAIQNGKWFLLENIGEELDKSLEPILLQQIVKLSGSLSITIGDKNLAYNNQFKMFMTTTIPNPHYSPETFVKVTMINFAITPQGLQDQMLAQLVALENPQLQQKKKDIVKRNAADKKQLLNIQDSILQSLSQGSGGIAELLLDQTLINQLQNSKKFASEINQRIKDSKITQEQIDKTRQGYRSVAYRASILFFCIIDLAGIDPMYQYSLQWFVNLFKITIQNALPAKQLKQRLTNLIDYFTYALYENVCRSLFEKHKLLFSFLLTAKIQFGKKQLEAKQWRYLLAGPSGDFKVEINPTTWISNSSWTDIFKQFYGMQDLPQLAAIYSQFMQNPDQFKAIFDALKPEEQPLPAPWQDKLNAFQKLIVLKAIRTDKVIPAIEIWISCKLGKQFIIPPTFDIAKCFKDSMNVTPLIFMLSPGSDPVSDFRKFSKEMEKKAQSISLGQGQGPKAHNLVKSGELRGTWILLQNCHLAASWMPQLQKIVEQFGQNTHHDFRLWLTSTPTTSFPISVLQNGVKMTIEPPEGLRANLLRSYNTLGSEELNDCEKPGQFKKLLFGFCFFHAIIQDRRKFGPIGWNIPYQFTNQDLNVCKRQLKMLLDEYSAIPYKVLNYLGAQINYGGRVTDDKDVRLIKNILKKYVTPQLFQPNYKFSRSGLYYAPNLIELSDFISYIQGLPLSPAPQAFGLHENAEITTAQNKTMNLLESILSIQPRIVTGQGKGRQEIIYEIAQGIQKKTPKEFDLQQVSNQYPTDYNQSMNTVLLQELVRYNRLIEVIHTSLKELKKALKGLVVMSEDLEKLSNSIYDNQVCKLWADKGFLSLKPLSSWIDDLILRVKFLSEWIEQGTPKVFWMSGFFFPQAFVTGSLQNYARTKAIAIDKLSFEFKFMDQLNHYSEITNKPQYGCYVYGLFLEGCRWSYHKHELCQSKPKELYSQLPIMHLIPCQERTKSMQFYNCPLYKVVSRSGTLSTTGHSTNFVMYIELPTDQPEGNWICSGVAAFLSLRY